MKATIFSQVEGQPLRILVVLESPLIDQANWISGDSPEIISLVFNSTSLYLTLNPNAAGVKSVGTKTSFPC